jgi:hypothetical protein
MTGDVGDEDPDAVLELFQLFRDLDPALGPGADQTTFQVVAAVEVDVDQVVATNDGLRKPAMSRKFSNSSESSSAGWFLSSFIPHL